MNAIEQMAGVLAEISPKRGAGRPLTTGRCNSRSEFREEITSMRDGGARIWGIAKTLGVGYYTVKRALEEQQ